MGASRPRRPIPGPLLKVVAVTRGHTGGAGLGRARPRTRRVAPPLPAPPVEFLTDDEAAEFGRYAGPPSQAELERVFFLDDEDRTQVAQRRGQHMKLRFRSSW